MRDLTADDMRWTTWHEPQLEDRDYLMMDDFELIDYVLALQTELRLMRVFWHETIEALAETATDRDKAKADQHRMRRGR